MGKNNRERTMMIMAKEQEFSDATLDWVASECNKMDDNIDWSDIYKQEEERRQQDAKKDTSLQDLLSEFADIDTVYKKSKLRTEEIEQKRKNLEAKILDYLEQNGLTAIESHGKKYRRTDFKFAYPEKDNKESMFQWLREEGYGGDIKQKEESIHPKKLASILEEVKKQGCELPEHKMQITSKIRVS